MLAHQNTTKRTSNDYTTSLAGLKFKIAHKRAGSEKWSATPKAQRKRMIMFLQNVIADLEKQNDSDRDGIAVQPNLASERHGIRPRRRSSVNVTRRRYVDAPSACHRGVVNALRDCELP